MGPKKKAGEEGEDLSTEQFMKVYKKNCQALECPVSKIIKERYESDYMEEGNPITKVSIFPFTPRLHLILIIVQFHVWEQLGWQGVKAIMDALRTVKYQHARSIRLWKTGCQDEGIRSVTQYMEENNSVVILELLDNLITPLGCEFIGRCLMPERKLIITTLKLDHNNIGSEGLNHLAKGLS